MDTLKQASFRKWIEEKELPDIFYSSAKCSIPKKSKIIFRGE